MLSVKLNRVPSFCRMPSDPEVHPADMNNCLDASELYGNEGASVVRAQDGNGIGVTTASPSVPTTDWIRVGRSNAWVSACRTRLSWNSERSRLYAMYRSDVGLDTDMNLRCGSADSSAIALATTAA